MSRTQKGHVYIHMKGELGVNESSSLHELNHVSYIHIYYSDIGH